MGTKLSHVVAASTLGLFEMKTAKIVICLYKAHSGADNGSMFTLLTCSLFSNILSWRRERHHFWNWKYLQSQVNPILQRFTTSLVDTLNFQS